MKRFCRLSFISIARTARTALTALTALIVLIVLINDASVLAQETPTGHPGFDRRQVLPFLDATYVAFAKSGDEWTFDGDIVPNFVVRQTFFDVIAEEEATRSKGLFRYRWAYSIVGVPMVRLRMFTNQPSAPVRTPSYMPKGTAQIFRFKLHDEKVDLFALQGTIGHHSNGQDGCLFANQDVNNKCLPEAPHDKTIVAVNKKDGSFSTNYVSFGFRYRYLHLEPKVAGQTERASDYERTLGIELELNPGNGRFLGGAGIDRELKSRYGPTRISLLGGLAIKRPKFCYRLEAKGFAKYIPGHGDGVPPWATSIEGQCLFRDTNWGVFGRYYHGQDYYNLGFQDNINRISFGMTYSQEGFLRFQPKQ